MKTIYINNSNRPQNASHSIVKLSHHLPVRLSEVEASIKNNSFKFLFVFISLLANQLINSAYSQTNTLDQFEYHYGTTNNQLQYVSDAVDAGNSTVDIDDQTNNNGSTENYAYNANGQLTKDEQANIQSISWCINGKVKEVVKTTGEKIKFYYDAMGNKVKKVKTNADQTTLTTYYTYQPTGGVVAVYEDNGTSITKVEAKLSNGTDQASIDITASVSTTKFTREITTKNYELTDHLGNVRATVSDVKELNTDLTTFSAQLTTANDYYAYGMLMPGRDYQSSNYRYGYQGMEKENDLNGNANAYDFGARILDPRLGRWLSTDPLSDIYPSLSPYNAMGNNPIIYKDPEGKSLVLFLLTWMDLAHAPASEQEAINAEEIQRISRLAQVSTVLWVANGYLLFVAEAATLTPAAIAAGVKAPTLASLMGEAIVYLGGTAAVAAAGKAAAVYAVGDVTWQVSVNMYKGKSLSESLRAIDYFELAQNAAKEGAQAVIGLGFVGGKKAILTGILAVEFLNAIYTQQREIEAGKRKELDYSEALATVAGLLLAKGKLSQAQESLLKEIAKEFAENRIQDVMVYIERGRQAEAEAIANGTLNSQGSDSEVSKDDNHKPGQDPVVKDKPSRSGTTIPREP